MSCLLAFSAISESTTLGFPTLAQCLFCTWACVSSCLLDASTYQVSTQLSCFPSTASIHAMAAFSSIPWGLSDSSLSLTTSSLSTNPFGAIFKIYLEYRLSSPLERKFLSDFHCYFALSYFLFSVCIVFKNVRKRIFQVSLEFTSFVSLVLGNLNLIHRLDCVSF